MFRMLHFRGAVCVLWACLYMYHASANPFPLPDDLDTDLDDINYTDIEPFPVIPEDPMQDYLLLKFMESLTPADYDVPQLKDEDNLKVMDNPPMLDDGLFPIMKRVPARKPATTEKPKTEGPVIKPIRKWHDRKHGKGQKNVVCYFKLCNFRLPVK